MRCFITGASGFIGSATARQLLARGHEVVGLTSSPARAEVLRDANVEPIMGDLRRPEQWVDAVRSADAVIHLATFPIPRRPGDRYVRSLVQAQETAVRYMLSAVSHNCRAFVFTSGMTVYGAGAEGRAETAPLSPYRVARAYAAGEALVFAAAQAGRVPGVVLRPAGVYGHGGIFGKFWAGPIAAGKRAAFPGDGNQPMSFVHVDDCAQAYVRCVEKPHPGEAFNVADDEPVTIGEMIRALAGAFGAPRPLGIAPALFRLASGGLVAEMMLNANVVANAKMKEVLGVRLQYATYREGIPALVRSAPRQPA